MKYGLLPLKMAEAIPWDKLCVDLLGSYKIQRKGQKELIVCRCVTMNDQQHVGLNSNNMTTNGLCQLQIELNKNGCQGIHGQHK